VDETYTNDLLRLKAAFKGISETPILARIIEQAAVSGSVRILDVGTGTGVSIQKVCDCLCKAGITSIVTGIDLFLPPESFRINDARIFFLQGDFNTFTTDETYDVVNATQMLYYFPRLKETLLRMIRLVRPGGILAATVWCSDCILYQVHKTFFISASSGPVLDEAAVQRHFSELQKGGQANIEFFSGPIDLNNFLEDEASIQSFLNIVSRQSGTERCTSATSSAVRLFLLKHAPIGMRKNAIVWLRVDDSSK